MNKHVTLNDVWPELESGIVSLLKNSNAGFSADKWIRLYTHVYDICTHTRYHDGSEATSHPSLEGGEADAFEEDSGGRPRPPPATSDCVASSIDDEGCMLYSRLRHLLIQHISNVVQKVKAMTDVDLLVEYKRQWESFKTSIKYISHIFKYLSRHWVKREQLENEALNTGRTVFGVHELGMILWKKHMLHMLQPTLYNVLLMLIQNERAGNVIESDIIYEVLQSCNAVSAAGDGTLAENDSATDLESSAAVPASGSPVATTSESSPFYEADPSFVSAYVNQMEHYYRTVSEKFISTQSISAYMRIVDRCLEQEEARVRRYLSIKTSASKILCRIESILIEEHKDEISRDFSTYLDQDAVEDLALMSSLYSRIDCAIHPITTAFEKHAVQLGLQRIAEVSAHTVPSPVEYVSVLLGVHSKYSTLLTHAFKFDTAFVAALDRACMRFINYNNLTTVFGSTKSPELISQYCDIVLRRSGSIARASSNTSIPDTQAEAAYAAALEKINSVMFLFKYIKDKDIFQMFYAKMLAKRLIYNRTISIDLEINLIQRFKQSCGFEYTTKLSRMIGDVEGSKRFQKKFQNDPTCPKSPIQFSVLVLGTSYWPLQAETTTFVSPKELLTWESAFMAFYCNSHNGRRLNWLYRLGKAEVRGMWPRKNKPTVTEQAAMPGKADFQMPPISNTIYTFQCSAYQLAVLLCYNASDTYTVAELQMATNIGDWLTLFTIHSLIKANVLVNKTCPIAMTEDLREDHVIAINRDFSSKRTRILLNVQTKGSNGGAGSGIASETSQEEAGSQPPRECRRSSDAEPVHGGRGGADAGAREWSFANPEFRRVQIETEIMKALKKCQDLDPEQLVAEINKAVGGRFRVPDVAIKECIELMAEQGYLEVTQGQSRYVYKP